MGKYGVKDKDKGYKSLVAELKKLAALEVKTGIQAGEQAPDGMDMARLASIHEFGGAWPVARKITHFKKLNKKGDKFLRQGRFVKRKRANYSESFDVEYTLSIPARPFMRNSIDEGKEEIGNFAQQIVRQVVLRKLSATRGMELIGQKMTGIIQKKIVDGPWTPNKPATIKKKRSSRPLIDSGRLRQSVRHIVKRRST